MPNWIGVNLRKKTRYIGRMVLTISDEMSVKRLVSPRLTTFRLTAGQARRRWRVCGTALGKLWRSWAYIWARLKPATGRVTRARSVETRLRPLAPPEG